MPSRRSFQMLNKGISVFSSSTKEIKTEIPKSKRHFIRMRQPFLPNVVTFAFETKDFLFRKYILLDSKVYTFALKSTHKRFRKYRKSFQKHQLRQLTCQQIQLIKYIMINKKTLHITFWQTRSKLISGHSNRASLKLYLEKLVHYNIIVIFATLNSNP